MVLEMAATMPECLDDLRAWRPKTYREHFAASRFSDRDAVIAAYEAADPAVREALDSAAQTLNAVLVEARDAVLAQLGTPDARSAGAARRGLVKPLIARAAALINGTAAAADRQRTQAAIDAMFAR